MLCVVLDPGVKLQCPCGSCPEGCPIRKEYGEKGSVRAVTVKSGSAGDREQPGGCLNP